MRAVILFLLSGAALAAKPNVLFLAIDDLCNQIGAYGVEFARTPSLDAFAASARPFTRHYVQVPTCGASRRALLSGRYPRSDRDLSNNAIKSSHERWAGEGMPGLFRAAGYRTLSLGKVSHYPGNRTGEDWHQGPEEMAGVWDRAWIPESPWKTAQGMMHGLANGVPRERGKSPALQAFDGPDTAYPDGLVGDDAVATLRELAEQEQPWFFAVGFFKPHLPFAAPARYHRPLEGEVPALDGAVAAKPDWPSGWHGSGEFFNGYGHDGRDPREDADYARALREAYAASVSYMDAQLGGVLDELARLGLEEETIVVVWSDHGFLLGEHAIWGKHCLYEHSLRSPLMIRVPGLARPGEASEAIVETVDLLPTLTELCGLERPEALDGDSLAPQLADPGAAGDGVALGFWNRGQRTLREDRWRVIARLGEEGAAERVELFDYEEDPDETRNHAAEHPEVVEGMLERLRRELP